MSAYYDMARWWNKYIDTYHINIHIIDVALQDIKKALSQTLSHPVMLLEPLMDLCQKFRDVELLISEAVCHIETVSYSANYFLTVIVQTRTFMQ